ncbi:MAG: type II secretion system F family protein [Eubacteriales bacterium]|nr:type II secretion system F family protein [Eubacteriales bacterium]
MTTLMPLILGVTTGLYLFLFSLVLLSMMVRDRRLVERRLRELVREDLAHDRPVKIKRTQRNRLPASQALANELITADIRMRPEEFLVIWILLTLVPASLLFLMNVHIITILGAALIGGGLPPYWIRNRKAKRLIKFEAQLSEAMVMVGNCLRSGLTFQQAMTNIANEMPDPIGREFSRVVREINLGGSVDSALNNLAERVKSMDLNLAVSAIQIQRQVGGNLLDLLENISETIKDRIKIKNEIRVMTASGRSSGMIIGTLPLGLAGVLMMINPDFIQSFFNTQIGIGMLITGAVMETIGFLMIKKVVSIKY